MKQIIAVDADDTIFDENTAVMEFHNRIYGTNHVLEDYLRPGNYGSFWEHIWKTDEVETLRRYEEFITHKLKYNIPPIPGALKVLRELKKDYELVIVTSRDERGVRITHEALEMHYPDLFSDVHFVPLWGGEEKATKAHICSEIGALFLIDDSHDHCQLAADAGITALLFGMYGWNVSQPHNDGIVRTKDWQAVRKYFNAREA